MLGCQAITGQSYLSPTRRSLNGEKSSHLFRLFSDFLQQKEDFDHSQKPRILPTSLKIASKKFARAKSNTRSQIITLNNSNSLRFNLRCQTKIKYKCGLGYARSIPIGDSSPRFPSFAIKIQWEWEKGIKVKTFFTPS